MSLFGEQKFKVEAGDFIFHVAIFPGKLSKLRVEISGKCIHLAHSPGLYKEKKFLKKNLIVARRMFFDSLFFDNI